MMVRLCSPSPWDPCSFPLKFAKFVPAWVTLCINTALLGMDAATIHHVRCGLLYLCSSRVDLRLLPLHCLQQHTYGPSCIAPP